MKQNLSKPAVFALLLALIYIIVCSGNGGFKTIGRQIFTNIKTKITVTAMEMYMPGFMYTMVSKEDEVSLQQYFYDEIFEMVPIYSYIQNQCEYATAIEDSITYDLIVAREAADENYIDKNGNLVESSADNASKDDSEEEKKEDKNNSKKDEKNKEDDTVVASQKDVQKQVETDLSKLSDFEYLKSNYYTVDSTTTIESSQLNADTLLQKDMSINTDNSQPQILIYHTHSQETYADSVPGDPETSVVGVGQRLTDILTNTYKFNVIHHTGEYDVDGRDYAYSNAAPAVEQLLKDNPSIEVVIDLHRDGVNENTRLVTEIDGKSTAQIMFFNGLSRTASNGDIDYLANPYIQDNLSLSLQLKLKATEYFPGFTRPIFLKGYRYNMHFLPKCLLIEVGAQTNTVQEAMNAMEPLAKVLSLVFLGEDKQ